MTKRKIAIVDDHQIVIDGLKLLLSDNHDVDVVYETTKPQKLIDNFQDIEIDILITDLMMPEIDGINLVKRLKAINPNLIVMVLSMNSDAVQGYELIHELGVQAYILKTIGKEEFNLAIKKVCQGAIYYSEEILMEVDKYDDIKKHNSDINLTTREIEIIQCIADDLTTKQIASKLFISDRTVETHRKNILRKTETHSVVSLLEFVKKNKILS